MQNISERLKLLRHQMRSRGIDIYLVPTTDAHNSEYVPEDQQRRAWISGFDGSNGEAVITLKSAYLWTDGRYLLQAAQQLDKNHYTLWQAPSFTDELYSWLRTNAKHKSVAIDPQLISIAKAMELKKIADTIPCKITFINDNLIDVCRANLGENTASAQASVYTLAKKYSGEGIRERLSRIQAMLKDKGVTYLVLNVLDEIAWLFNIRGGDIDYNPLVVSYAIIAKDSAYLFIDKKKLSSLVTKTLNSSKLIIKDYADFNSVLSKLKGKIWLDNKTANYAMLNNIDSSKVIETFFSPSPISSAKASKNETEIQGARTAHIKDAVAKINFLSWLEHNYKNGVDEIGCSLELNQFRLKQGAVMNSFAPISAFAGNAAIIHYKATDKSAKIVDDSSLYLIDSGGQYLEGTTDITRTIHLGTPTAKQKYHYTLVLRGHLALGRAVFPHGTCGEQLDVLARQYLWGACLNYAHGTGHGVGSFLCVHEGPQRISTVYSGVALLPGMIVSNEPGVYFADLYGIRIENLCIVRRLESKLESKLTAKKKLSGISATPFYTFETLTLVPYCKKLIDMDMLDDVEKQQLKRYYKQIKSELSPKLDKIARKWLNQELDIF